MDSSLWGPSLISGGIRPGKNGSFDVLPRWQPQLNKVWCTKKKLGKSPRLINLTKVTFFIDLFDLFKASLLFCPPFLLVMSSSNSIFSDSVKKVVQDYESQIFSWEENIAYSTIFFYLLGLIHLKYLTMVNYLAILSKSQYKDVY